MSLKNGRSEPKEILGLNRITKKRLRELCRKDRLYQTPALNDVLYLHFQGFQCIECLEEYTELKCLWLESNALSEIQGLENQHKLKCLFLQSNLIKKIENLEFCKELDTINLSQNLIRKIENVNSDILPVLNSLNLSSNYITDSDGVRELENCKNLSVVDLSNNRIHDILVVKVFAKMPELKVLILQGNPVVSKIPQYRKTLILECKNLTYLDSRPVFPKDRACAEAWKRGGYQEERKENERWNRKDRKKIRDSVNATIRMRNRHRKPEDQLSILLSSDSDDEVAASERRRQHQELDAGVSMELGVWDEVDNNLDRKSESASSTDMNVSSSTSVISSTDSNADSYNGSCKDDDEDKANKDKGDENILNPVEVMSKEIIVDLLGQESFRASYRKQTDSNHSLTTEMTDLPPESPNEIQQFVSPKRSKKTENDIEEADKQAEIEQIPENNKPYENDRESENQEQSPILPKIEASGSSLNESDDEPKECYDPTIEAIHRATMNNLSDVSESRKPFERRVFLQIETNEDNYEPMNEMEEAMNTMPAKSDAQTEGPTTVNDVAAEEEINTPKTEAEIEVEDKFSKINEEAAKNFEIMSANMDVAMAQFQKDQEERQRVFEALFTQEVAAKDTSTEESSDELNDRNIENDRIERMVDQWDRQTRLKGGKKRKVVNASFSTSQQIDMWSESTAERDSITISTSVTTKTDIKICKINEISSNGNEKSAEDILRSIKKDVGKQEIDMKMAHTKSGSGDGLEILDDSSTNIIGHKRDIPCEIADSVFVNKIEYSDCSKNNVAMDDNVEPQEQMTSIVDIAHMFNIDDTAKVQVATKANVATTAIDEGTEPVGDSETFGTSLKVDQPMDVTSVTREANEALKAFEKESKYLNELLQKLEDHNEKLYKDLGYAESSEEIEEVESSEVIHEADKGDELMQENNCQVLDIMGENTKEVNTKETDNSVRESSEDLSYIERTDETGILTDDNNVEKYDGAREGGSNSDSGESVVEEGENEAICAEILNDMVHKLDIKTQKPLSYEFPDDLETDEDDDEGAEPREALHFSNTIRDVIDSFTAILDQKSPEGYIYRYDSQKTSVLKQLANSPNLKQFNEDTHESLDKQLAEYEREQSNTVRNIVNRVYAKKDRYDDTIELIDGKLMVVHKDSGDVRPLTPTGRHNNTDESDAHNDTADSDEEDRARRIRLRRKHWPASDTRRERCSQDGWRSFASTSSEGLDEENANRDSNTHSDNNVNVWPRRWGPYTRDNYKPSEVRMREALGAAKYNEDSDDENNFYSVDDQKPATIYGRIANEICDSMTFDHINILSDDDENHIVQCARSYEELREVLKAEKEDERHVTAEENELLEKMLESNYARGADKTHMDSGELRVEDEQLRILLERNREYSARDNRAGKLSQSDTSIYKPAKEHIKLLEYNPHLSMADTNACGESLAETGDAISEETDCAEIYGSDIFSYIHGEELENKKEEAELFPQNVLNWKKYECVNYKEIKETLNRKEKQLDNEEEEIESLKTNRCSESEKNEIEMNVDIECPMEETQSATIININNIDCPESSRSTHFDDLQKIADNIEEISMCPSNESLPSTHELNDIGSLEHLPNVDKYSEDIKRSLEAIEEINSNSEGDVIQSLSDNIVSLFKVEEFERIDEKEECLEYQTDKITSQQGENSAGLIPNIAYIKKSLETLEEVAVEYENINFCSETIYKQENTENEKIPEAVIFDSYACDEDQQCTSADLTMNDDTNEARTIQQIDPIDDDSLSREEPDYNNHIHLITDEPPLETDLSGRENQCGNIEVEVDNLECNLEVLGCNGEVIDNITVNAEVHYQN